MPTKLTVIPTGDTILASATGDDKVAATLYSDAALTLEVTLPLTITASTTLYAADRVGGHTDLVFTQLDGTVLGDRGYFRVPLNGSEVTYSPALSFAQLVEEVDDLAGVATAAGTAATVDKADKSPRVPLVAGIIELPSAVEVFGQFVHPTIVDAGAGGWNGYRYWLAASCYPFNEKEIPYLFCSADGLNWDAPAGLTNPFLPLVNVGYLQSDPDILLVGSTLHAWSREHHGSSPSIIERIYHSTSTDGITWAAQALAVEYTGGTAATRAVSPAVVNLSGTLVMFTSHAGTTIHRRTSADGTTWAAPTSVTLTGWAGGTISHLDVVPSGTDSRLFALVADASADGTPETASQASLWLGVSNDGGASFTFDADPILTSQGVAARKVYRTTGLHEQRDGVDYFRLWYSGSTDLPPGTSSGWVIGYTEGNRPGQAATKDSLDVPGSVLAAGDVVGRHGGFLRVGARFGGFVRTITNYLSATFVKTNYVLIDQPAALLATPPWTATTTAPLVIRGATDTTWADGARPEIRLYARSTDISGIAADDYWMIRVKANGTLELKFNDTSAVTATGLEQAINGDTTYARDLTARIVKGTSATVGAKGDFGASSDGGNAADNPLRVWGDNLRIVNSRTVAAANNNDLYTGTICWDANYIYVKTGASAWKRVAISTW